MLLIRFRGLFNRNPPQEATRLAIGWKLHISMVFPWQVTGSTCGHEVHGNIPTLQ